MPPRQPKKPATVRKQPDATAALRQALSGRTKADLVAGPDELEAATRRAISDATDFDERDSNRNFDYDSDAYDEVQRNLGRLIAAGHLRPAMQLALDLMK